MHRRGLAWLVCCGMAFGCAGKTVPLFTAPTPPPEDATAYYPLQSGWKWAYDVDSAGQQILAVYSVTERTADSVVIAAGADRIYYALSPEGIARRDGFSVGDFILRSPVRAGAEWVISAGKARIVSVGRSVTVTAGTFENCATVEETRTNPGRVTRTTYALGVGPISLEQQVHDPLTGKFAIATRAVLRGVTRPGEDGLGL